MYWVVVALVIVGIIVGWFIYLEVLESKGHWVSGGHSWDLPKFAIIVILVGAVAVPKFLDYREAALADCGPAADSAGASLEVAADGAAADAAEAGVAGSVAAVTGDGSPPDSTSRARDCP